MIVWRTNCRPQAAGQGYVSIFAAGALSDRVEWPVFGKQIDDLTAATRPIAAIQTHQIDGQLAQ
jgi:hypothetical protein